MIRRISKILLVLLYGSLLLTGLGQAAPTCTICSYDNPGYRVEASQFTPEKTIYLSVLLQDIAPGKHRLTIDWHDPTGQVQEQTMKSFSTDKASVYQQTFALRLNKLGRVTRMVTGLQYPDRFYGRWFCSFYLDGVKIHGYSFEVI